jgi:hypothetical protein
MKTQSARPAYKYVSEGMGANVEPVKQCGQSPNIAAPSLNWNYLEQNKCLGYLPNKTLARAENEDGIEGLDLPRSAQPGPQQSIHLGVRVHETVL